MSKDDFPDSERGERKELGITMKREGGGKESEMASEVGGGSASYS